ncbi:PglZ domain-containing protein [Archangium violaceum]|uniref:PglZ domain-containing protein n=1 Tax=Archangium violaceum TaxID=83451 RepID=UPI00194F7FF3|nr:PglZ domain-containing protein [Archangium violaceum]QRN94041.1 PglZ domain-containing protein [Archangium violaceum]
MRPSQWARDRTEALARHHKLVWVEDPYQMLEESELGELRKVLEPTGRRVVCVDNAFRLREALDGLGGDARAAKAVIVDQSYTIRDPHLLPKDAKPSDLRPLPAPDWKPCVAADAFFRPNIREFLMSMTGFEDWPVQVNIYPYEKLARERPAALVKAYETFRRMGRALTDSDLVVVGASAVLGVDLFDITSPVIALELAFHSQDGWQAVEELFNPAEQEIVRRHLRSLPRPLGDLFGEHAETARLALVSLLLLRQHFEEPGKQLPFLSPALGSYRDCDVLPSVDAPSWFSESEVPRFEQACGDEFLRHIRDTLDLGSPEKARTFAQRERLSRKLRSLVPFEVQAPESVHESGGEDFRLDQLVPEFLHLKKELETIIHATKGVIEGLRLSPLKNQTARQLIQIFIDRGFHRVDRIVGRLESLIYFIEGPARHQWRSVTGFEARWSKEQRACRDTMALAGRLRDELDLAFGKLLEARYAEIVPSEVLTTDLFYEKFIAPRRRTSGGGMRKAVVLVVDSMRVDIWRELLRPALERDYEVEESFGFALLPSETHVSRRSFFAGLPPASTPSSGSESELFAQLLSTVHGSAITFEELPRRRPGMRFGVRTRDQSVHAAVFDFPDALSHEVDWDPHTLQEGQRHLIREIRALLADIGPEAMVFITADHGHILQQRGAPVNLRDADDVGYRSAYVTSRVEGHDAARVFQIPARDLRHGSPGWFVFPRPGHALRDGSDASRRFRPSANYRHGGISLFEVVVPLIRLKHRTAKAQVRLVAHAAGAFEVGVASVIELSVSADGILSSPVSLAAAQPAVESTVVTGVTTTPQTVKLRYVPGAPGKHTLQLTALLAGDKVGETSIEVDVAPARAKVDVARAKLARLFGDT